VDIFGVDRHDDCRHWEHANNATNTTLHNKHTNITQTHHEPLDCCSNVGHNMEGCDSNTWGLDTLIHLPIGLVMLAFSIISASLTCMVKEEPDEGVVWAQQPGGMVHNRASANNLQHLQPSGGLLLPPTYTDALSINQKF
jgi:hypothetical protein